jgi:hypothetical protein
VEIPYLDFAGSSTVIGTAGVTKVKIDTANNRLRALQTTMVGKGLPVYEAKTNLYYTATLGVDLSTTDSIHPNNLGHREIFNAIYAALNSSNPSPGTLQYGSDGNFYGANINGQETQIAYINELGLQNVIANNGVISSPSVITATASLSALGTVQIDSTYFSTNSVLPFNTDGFISSYGNGNGIRFGFNAAVGESFQFESRAVGFWSMYNENDGKSSLEGDSVHFQFLNLPYTHGTLTPYTGVVAIQGNQNGVAGHTPLVLGEGEVTSAIVPGGLVTDSTYLLVDHSKPTPTRDTVAFRSWVEANFLSSVTTPTFQQVLTAGSTLTSNNTVALGANNLIFSGGEVLMGAISGTQTWNPSTQVVFGTGASTLNDATTSASGTVTNVYENTFTGNTMTATNTAVTYTNGYTVYINGGPSGGSNVSVTNPYSLGVSGAAIFKTQLSTNSLAINTWQTVTTGTTSTVSNNQTNWLLNLSSLAATFTVTLPAAPVDGQLVKLHFGGTISGGSTVVTALTVSANSGQTITQSAIPTTALSGNCYIYEYNAALAIWYREQ